MQKITVRVGKDGQVTVRMEGVKGPKCVELTKALRDGLGETIALEHTAEYDEGTEVERAGPALEQQREG